jgi:hypothetical protein
MKRVIHYVPGTGAALLLVTLLGSALLGSALLGSALTACSSDEGSDPAGAVLPNTPPPAGSSGKPPTGAGGSDSAPGVDNFNRPPGMPIGRGVGQGPTEGDPTGAPLVPSQPDDDGEIEIPVFETPDEDQGPPCAGCLELNIHVDDINQRDDFVFSAGGVNVTRVVWTIIVPFNSDQLFVQPFVDASYGTYTDLDANAFAVDTPIQLVHEFSGSANTVGLAIGSAGAWTGDMTMSVFVDSVTLEGSTAASRSFDSDAQGMATRTSAHEPRVVYHP